MVFIKTAGFCSLFNWDLESQLDLTLCNATLTYWRFMNCICVHLHIKICILSSYICIYICICVMCVSIDTFSISIDTLLAYTMELTIRTGMTCTTQLVGGSLLKKLKHFEVVLNNFEFSRM